MIVETAYPWKNTEWWSKRKNMAWPISAAGQQEFLSDLVKVVKQTPGGHGIGVVYWHPESIPGKGPNGRAWNGGAMALFDDQGNALPAMDILGR